MCLCTHLWKLKIKMDSNNEILTQIAVVLSHYPIIKKRALFNLERDGSSYRMSYVDLITEQNSC